MLNSPVKERFQCTLNTNILQKKRTKDFTANKCCVILPPLWLHKTQFVKVCSGRWMMPWVLVSCQRLILGYLLCPETLLVYSTYSSQGLTTTCISNMQASPTTFELCPSNKQVITCWTGLSAIPPFKFGDITSTWYSACNHWKAIAWIARPTRQLTVQALKLNWLSILVIKQDFQTCKF